MVITLKKGGGIRNFRLDFIVFKHEQKIKYSSWSSSFKLTYFHLATNENVFAWKAASVRAHQQTLARESSHCDQCLAPPQAGLQTAHAISVRNLSANLNKISSEENLNVHHTSLHRQIRTWTADSFARKFKESNLTKKWPWPKRPMLLYPSVYPR